MSEVGTVLHLTRSGQLILRAGEVPDPGAILYDDEGRRVAKVVEVFGPVGAPYISATPLTDRVKKLIGRKIYASRGGSKVVQS